MGDGIWIARHKEDHTEYVLDFVVERKEVMDLDGSIEDNRYRDQKLRMKRCGLRKLIYLVEGDLNRAPKRVKTAYVHCSSHLGDQYYAVSPLRFSMDLMFRELLGLLIPRRDMLILHVR